MRLAIMQPYFFPYIGYFQLLNTVDKFVVYDDVNFIKQGWINRNRIIINGTPQFLTVPLKKASPNKLILETLILENSKWQRKLLRTIEMSYKKAPNFEIGYSIVEKVIQLERKNISELAYYSILKVKEYLEIPTPMESSSSIYSNKHLKGQERVLDICHQEKADWYINPIGGQDLYDRELFQKNKIKLSFIQTEKVNYQQFDGDFIPYLSIIDMIMFLSKSEIQDHLQYYKLI